MIVCFELHGSMELEESRHMQQGAPADAARRANHVSQARGGAGQWKFNVQRIS